MSFKARISFIVESGSEERVRSSSRVSGNYEALKYEIWYSIQYVYSSHVRFSKILIFLLDKIGCFLVKRVSLSIHKIIINMLNFTSLNLTDCSHEDHKDNWTPTPPSFLSYLKTDLAKCGLNKQTILETENRNCKCLQIVATNLKFKKNAKRYNWKVFLYIWIFIYKYITLPTCPPRFRKKMSIFYEWK